MRCEFPVREIATRFGPLIDPTIVLPMRTPRGFRPFWFLMDSGADFSMMPRSQARRLGVELKGATEVQITGIDGVPQRAPVREIALRIGEAEVHIPCVFSPNPDAPYLIGRMGFFSRFNITFDNRRKKIVLETI